MVGKGGGVSNVDRDGKNALSIKAIGAVISAFETRPQGARTTLGPIVASLAHRVKAHRTVGTHTPAVISGHTCDTDRQEAAAPRSVHPPKLRGGGTINGQGQCTIGEGPVMAAGIQPLPLG